MHWSVLAAAQRRHLPAAWRTAVLALAGRSAPAWRARVRHVQPLGEWLHAPEQTRQLAHPSSRQSVSTAYHALSFTTLLLRRWLAYYALLSSVIRLVALQAICWPLVRLTLHICGPSNPAAAWVVIGTTTAISDTVARWVTLNIADAPDEAAGNGARAAKRRREPGRRFWRAIMGAPQADRRTARRGWEADATIAEHSDVGETDAATEAETDTQSPRSRSYRRRMRGPSSRSDAATPREEEPGRVFHWDVTMRRNVLPVACLGYATMLVLLADSMR
jgi:hypothetical protein